MPFDLGLCNAGTALQLQREKSRLIKRLLRRMSRGQRPRSASHSDYKGSGPGRGRAACVTLCVRVRVSARSVVSDGEERHRALHT